MGKGERQQNSEYIEDVEKVIASLSCRDKLKYEFSKRFEYLEKLENGRVKMTEVIRPCIKVDYDTYQ